MSRIIHKLAASFPTLLLAVAVVGSPAAASAAKPGENGMAVVRGSVAVATPGRAVTSSSAAVTSTATPAAIEPLVKPLNVAPAELFDHYVSDPAIRALAKSRFNLHKALTRNDMILIFRQVEKSGAMSQTEFNSLRMIVADAAMVHMADYVRDLSTKVVYGNAANSHYQGKSLGNLRVGSSAGQLELLVKKWFLGADHPATNPDSHYELAQGVLYNGQPRLTDLHQGDVADCFFLSSLGETALLDWKDVASMFHDNGDKTFTIRFYHNGKPTYVTVDRYLPVDGDHNLVYDGQGTAVGDAQNILWVALAEKAFVQLNETGWVKSNGPSGVNAYVAYDKGGCPDVIIPVISGLPATASSVTSINSVNSRELTVAASVDKPSAGIVPWHIYAVTNYDAARHTVTLYNPWGSSGDEAGIKYGTFTLSWNDFVANFKAVDHSTRPTS